MDKVQRKKIVSLRQNIWLHCHSVRRCFCHCHTESIMQCALCTEDCKNDTASRNPVPNAPLLITKPVRIPGSMNLMWVYIKVLRVLVTRWKAQPPLERKKKW